MRVPLYQILKEPSGVRQSGQALEGLERISEIELPFGKEIPEECYAINIEEDSMAPALKKADLAVFAPQEEPGQALMNVFLVRIQNQPPQVRMVVRTETGPDPANFPEPATGPTTSYINKRRKSFMTPTPLHIPGSRVSPIPGSAHEMVYLKSLQPEHLSVVPAKEVLWMHPLIHIHSL